MSKLEEIKQIANKAGLKTFTMGDYCYISKMDTYVEFGSPRFVPKLFNPYVALEDAFSLLEFSEYQISKTSDQYCIKIKFYKSNSEWIETAGTGKFGLQDAICEAYLKVNFNV